MSLPVVSDNVIIEIIIALSKAHQISSIAVVEFPHETQLIVESSNELDKIVGSTLRIFKKLKRLKCKLKTFRCNLLLKLDG